MMDVLTPLRTIPLSVNTAYGDAFQPTQWNDTIAKVRDSVITQYTGHLMIGTKYIVSSRRLDELQALSPDLWVFLAVTGLNETRRFSLTDYRRFYTELCERFPRTVCAIRPIIPSRNDRIDLLMPILEMVAGGGRLLTFTGYRDPYKAGSKKYENLKLANKIYEKCRELGITAREKCACIVAATTGDRCPIHSAERPLHQETLGLLGYDLECDDLGIRILGYRGSSTVTKGDLSFARLICRSSLIRAAIGSPSAIMQFRVEPYDNLVCTSSFFDWARQTKCHIGCDYCFANLFKSIGILLPEFGENPVRLADQFESTRAALP